MTVEEAVEGARAELARLRAERDEVKAALGLAAGGVGLTLPQEVERLRAENAELTNRCECYEGISARLRDVESERDTALAVANAHKAMADAMRVENERLREAIEESLPLLEDGTWYDDYDAATVRLNRLRAARAPATEPKREDQR